MTPASTLAAALESALDLYLKQDPDVLRHCAALEGKVIAVDITGLDLSLYFMPDATGILVSSRYEGEPDTRLRGSPFGFARLALDTREDVLFEGIVDIQGDTETGQQFQDLLSAVDLDWEEMLSRFTGDVIAHQAGELVRSTRQWLAHGRDTLQQDLSEYLQEEAHLLPTRVETGYFLADVDRLRADIDRLAARIHRLQQNSDTGA
ncbi:MAG TPA: sterol-binding protein [Gammaproteobacteria bacterium]|nr:sterol-binding protein [Gammaproteobacteria bacterium]